MCLLMESEEPGPQHKEVVDEFDVLICYLMCAFVALNNAKHLQCPVNAIEQTKVLCYIC